LEYGSNYKDCGELELEEELKQDWQISPPLNRIVECRYDPDWPNNWRVSRFRDDKLTANHISTFEKILISIRDNVTHEEV
jgi:mRNA guanylyltransferase